MPGGFVHTFLLTDIEGSTRLWETQPEAMREALALHDTLLRNAIESNGGRVIQTVGDSFGAAFPNAAGGVAAAIAVQHGLPGLVTRLSQPLHVRMALHTGEAEVRGHELVGVALTRVNKLAAIGYGEQVLLSQAAVDALEAEGVRHDLRLLGDHRLREMQQPETVYQLLGPGLRADFPPLRSPVVAPTNLPQQTATLLGRAAERERIAHLVAHSRVVTVVGAGGCGKTRLTLEVAAERLGHYKDGVWLVELEALSDPGAVPDVVGAAVGIGDGTSLDAALHGRSLLLLLDNAEHLRDACAELVVRLRDACPHVHILVTSRERLGIDGETLFVLEALETVDPDRPLDEIAGATAVQLFVERAVAQLPTFALNEANAPAVARICQRLDGNPLAIELAAGRIKALPVERILERLDDRFRLLTGGSRTALPRHQSLRGLIAWSWARLSEPERCVLERLSVLDEGWSVDAARVACAGSDLPADRVGELLESLREKCLLTAPGRVPESVRQFAAERLAARASV